MTVKTTSPYRFDVATEQFDTGEHDFSTDLRAAAAGDREANARALGFARRQFAVAISNVPGLDSRARPNVTIEQRDYPQPPLWAAAVKGSLTNGAPFGIPKLTPVAALAGPHTEGVEPPATFSGSRDVVTPKPVSGKVEITREVWDLKGADISTLIWGRMEAAYMEALENAVATKLTADAAAIADVVITTAAVDVALVDAVLDAVAAFAFAPGGSQNARAVLHTDLYRGLARAKDSTGRKLLTGCGPANSEQAGQSLDLQGVPGLPGWALGATSTASSNSWLIDPRALASWASVPQRLEFQYRLGYVDVGLWGYQAVAITDASGIRQLTYDPA